MALERRQKVAIGVTVSIIIVLIIIAVVLSVELTSIKVGSSVYAEFTLCPDALDIAMLGPNGEYLPDISDAEKANLFFCDYDGGIPSANLGMNSSFWISNGGQTSTPPTTTATNVGRSCADANGQPDDSLCLNTMITCSEFNACTGNSDCVDGYCRLNGITETTCTTNANCSSIPGSSCHNGFCVRSNATLLSLFSCVSDDTTPNDPNDYYCVANLNNDPVTCTSNSDCFTGQTCNAGVCAGQVQPHKFNNISVGVYGTVLKVQGGNAVVKWTSLKFLQSLEHPTILTTNCVFMPTENSTDASLRVQQAILGVNGAEPGGFGALTSDPIFTQITGSDGSPPLFCAGTDCNGTGLNSMNTITSTVSKKNLKRVPKINVQQTNISKSFLDTWNLSNRATPNSVLGSRPIVPA